MKYTTPSKRGVITACDEHFTNITPLRFKKGVGWYCPTCGKFKWPALHEGIRAYNERLIKK